MLKLTQGNLKNQSCAITHHGLLWFAVLFEKMLELEIKILDEFIQWYQSDHCNGWKAVIEANKLDDTLHCEL